MSQTLKITAANGVTFNVRIVRTGDNYGLNDCLTHEDAEPMVEFYDARYNHSQFGQFVSRYNMSTMIDRTAGFGLNLCGFEREWTIDAGTMQTVNQWLKGQ